MADKFPSWKQALITFVGGIILAGSTCFGFLLSLEGNDNLAAAMAIAFIGSIIVIVVGFVFVIMRVVQGTSQRPQAPQPPPPPGVGGLA